MRRHWIWPVLLVLVMGLTACQVEITPTPMPDDSSKASDPAPVPPPPDSDTADPNTGDTAKPELSNSSISGAVGVVEPAVPDDNDKEPSRASQDYTMEGYRWYLEGEWIGVEGEIEGDRYNLADSHAALELTFLSCDGVTEDGHGEWGMAARYDYTYNYDDHETLDNLYVEFHEGPMYYGCGNDEWYAELKGGPEGIEYTVTVIDNNYLELQRYVEDSYVVWVAYCQRADGRWIED